MTVHFKRQPTIPGLWEKLFPEGMPVAACCSQQGNIMVTEDPDEVTCKRCMGTYDGQFALGKIVEHSDVKID